MLAISVKHTFLDFQWQTLTTSSSVRSHSAPPLRYSHTSALMHASQVQAPCFPKDCATQQMQGPFMSTGGAQCSSQCGSTQQLKAEGRPCKSKRVKFHKFVEWVKQQVLQDPNFEIKDLKIPKSLDRGHGTMQKIVSLVQAQLPCIPNGGVEFPSPSQAKKGRVRPNKAERDKFCKFIDDLKQKVLLDPNFKLDNVHIPQSLDRGVRTRQKIINIVQESVKPLSKCD